jgi:dGTPase
MAESMRKLLEKGEAERLAPYALRSADATRRLPVEDDGRAFDYRTAYQRDRDRIVYSRAFRRLRQKAVTGILPAYEDHRRNRLTHTLEVVQVARTIGRALALNEDLVEAVALAHDLGQPPFGPAGVAALDDLLSGGRDGRGGPGLSDLGGFDAAWQALRVVDLLEKRYEHPGLNLADATREGIVKAQGRGRAPAEVPDGLRPGRPGSFEAQVVTLSVRLASALHDLDDALQSGTVELAEVERLRAVKELKKKLGSRYPQRGGRFMKANAIHRGLTHLLVTGAILGTQRTLAKWQTKNKIEDSGRFLEVRDEAVTGSEVAWTRGGGELVSDLEGFLDARVHRGREAEQVDARGRLVLLGLFAAYFADPVLLDDHVLFRMKDVTGVRYLRDLPRAARDREARTYRSDPRFTRLLADHLAAMTDTYALAEHARLLEMGAVPIPSLEQLRREDAP